MPISRNWRTPASSARNRTALPRNARFSRAATAAPGTASSSLLAACRSAAKLSLPPAASRRSARRSERQGRNLARCACTSRCWPFPLRRGDGWHQCVPCHERLDVAVPLLGLPASRWSWLQANRSAANEGRAASGSGCVRWVCEPVGTAPKARGNVKLATSMGMKGQANAATTENRKSAAALLAGRRENVQQGLGPKSR